MDKNHTLFDLIIKMKAADIQGPDCTDEPEGTRYITVSETLWKQMINHLERVLDNGRL
jgi:hypothetical protein